MAQKATTQAALTVNSMVGMLCRLNTAKGPGLKLAAAECRWGVQVAITWHKATRLEQASLQASHLTAGPIQGTASDSVLRDLS